MKIKTCRAGLDFFHKRLIFCRKTNISLAERISRGEAAYHCPKGNITAS